MSPRVIHGDALEVLRSTPEYSVGAIITDPPYGVGYAPWDGAVPPPDVLRECLRVSSGPVVWFGAASCDALTACLSYDPPPERMLVWHVPFSLSNTGKHGMFYRWHPIWCWRLPTKVAVLRTDVLEVPTEGRHWWNHPATKPLRLMRLLVAAFTIPGSVVLDPFCGSGTTGVACVEEGRDFVGIEREATYVEVARRRIEVGSTPSLFSGGGEAA